MTSPNVIQVIQHTMVVAARWQCDPIVTIEMSNCLTVAIAYPTHQAIDHTSTMEHYQNRFDGDERVVPCDRAMPSLLDQILFLYAGSNLFQLPEMQQV